MKLLVVSPHMDDETLGAGGTILKYKHLGNQVAWLNFTSVKEEYGYSKEVVINRKDQLDAVRKLYQADEFLNLELKPSSLDGYEKIYLIEKVGQFLRQVRPNMVIVPFKNDVHSDHRVSFEIVYSCTKVFRYPFVETILMMEVLSETDFASSDCGFVPNYFVDISEYLAKKIEIMKIYQSEIDVHPFPRSEENIKALATLRGAASGRQYAEGFMLLKAIR
ncbi:MAG: PIG-L deacetylase family protein [Bacillota bacterium]